MSDGELMRLLREGKAAGWNTPLLQMAYVEALERGGTVAARAEEQYQRRVRQGECPFLNGDTLNSLRRIVRTLAVDLDPPADRQTAAYDGGVLVIGIGCLLQAIAALVDAEGIPLVAVPKADFVPAFVFAAIGGAVLYGAFAGRAWMIETVAVARARGLSYALDRLSRAYSFPALEDKSSRS